jgi:GTPase SAR1 family protein
VQLVANKCDQESQRAVTTREANEFCKTVRPFDIFCSFVQKPFLMPEVAETSAKTGLNVEKAFMDLAHQVHHKLNKD